MYFVKIVPAFKTLNYLVEEIQYFLKNLNLYNLKFVYFFGNEKINYTIKFLKLFLVSLNLFKQFKEPTNFYEDINL